MLGISVVDLVNMQDKKMIYAINNHQPTIENMINNATVPHSNKEQRIKSLEKDVKLLKSIINKQ